VIIKHAKISSVPDGPDVGSVRPSDWNADHVVSMQYRDVDDNFALTQSDDLFVIRVTSLTGVTCSLPNTLPDNFKVTIVQAGTGTVTFAPETNATLRNRLNHASTAGDPSVAELYVVSNSDGGSAVYVLSGDTA
jgi:hypothetical protein